MIPYLKGKLCAFLVISLIAAFGAGPASAADAPPAISDGVVKVGLLLDMTGPFADQTGLGSATAARMAVEDFGGKVLGAPIEIVVADHHDSPDQAAAIARRWFDSEHVDAIMDVSGSSAALIVQRIGDVRDKIVLLSAPAAERLTNEACTANAIHYGFDTYAIAHSLGSAVVARGGDTWFFITVDYSYGYDLENDTSRVIKARGGVVLGHARHPLDALDMSSYLLQAQQSQAKVIGIANSGTDVMRTIRQAAKLGMIPGPQLFAALGLRLTGVVELGLPVAQGLLTTEPFYWDLDGATRGWSRRFFDRMNKMPNSRQAAVYSSTMHYLQAVAKTATDATGPVMQAMRAAPVDDFYTHGGHIRADGALVQDMHLFQVKTPAESKERWDAYKLLATIPGDQAYRPLSQSKCPLVNAAAPQ